MSVEGSHLCSLVTTCRLRKRFSLFLPQAPLLGRNYVFILLTFSASFNSFLCLSSWHNETWCCTFGMWLQTLPPLWVSLAKSNSWVVPSSVSCVLPMCQREQGTWKDPEVSQRPVRYSQHINIVGLWTRNCPAQAGKGHLFITASWLCRGYLGEKWKTIQ